MQITKEQIAAAQKSLEGYWVGSVTQSVVDDYASGNFVTVKAG
jgi:hypothetical protein